MSGLDKRKILGGSGSAKGLKASFSFSSIIPANVDCDETLLFFLRSLFLSLFLLDERLTGSPAAKNPRGSFVE